MTNTEESDTDFGSLEHVSDKYRALKASVASTAGLCTKCTAVAPLVIQSPSACFIAAAADEQVKAEEAKKPLSPDNTRPMPKKYYEEDRSVEDIKEIEKTRLAVWLTKFSAVSATLLVGGFIVIFGYVAYSTQVMPTAPALNSLFGGIKDIILAILNAGK
jgi:hypothetical protein